MKKFHSGIHIINGQFVFKLKSKGQFSSKKLFFVFLILILSSLSIQLKAQAGNALDFDGTNDYVLTSGVVLGTTFTQEMWVYPTDAALSYKSILGTNAADNFPRHPSVYQYGKKIHFGFGNGSVWYSDVTDKDVLTINSWNQIAVTFNGTDYLIYVNGSLVYSSACASGKTPNTATLQEQIGSSFNNSFFKGQIDEVRIWNDVRTKQEIRENMCRSLVGDEAGLVRYYCMNELSGTNLPDLTSNHINGTLTNMENVDWITSTAFTTWFGSSSTEWTTASNWSDGVPGTIGKSVNAGISNLGNSPIISSGVSVNNLVIGSGATLSVSSNTLTTSGNLWNQHILSIALGTVDANGIFDATDGSVTFTDAGNLTLGGTATSLGIFTEGTGTVNYDKVGDQSILTDTYYNLATSGSGAKTLLGTTNVGGSLTIGSLTTLALGANSATATGTTDNNGTMTVSTGTFDANGAFDATVGSVTFTGSGNLKLGNTVTNLGAFTKSTGTVTYDGIAQTVALAAYNNLTVSNDGLKTITIGTTISGTGTISDNAKVLLTVTATGINKTYDGNTSATAAYSTGNIFAAYTVSATGTAAFVDKNVANNINVNIIDVTLEGADLNKFTLNGVTTAATTASITKATPNITWSNPTNIVYGTALSAAELNATSPVAGTFVYTPALATLLNAGAGQTLSVSFTPTDAANYTTNTATATINVTKATPNITWPNPTNIVYGTALSAAELNATSPVAGTFVYTPALATLLGAGAGQTLSVSFTPTDAANYTTNTATATINVTKATPMINEWPTAAEIAYGDDLSSATLSGGTASVVGSYAYDDSTIVPNAGTYNATITFIPTDAANYNTVAGNVTITINKLANVTTQDVTDIAITTATGNGNITDLGTPDPSAYGVCWNTSGTPTISDGVADNGAASSTGAYTVSMTSLSANTTYYVRAYATNTAGTNYGAEVSFTTGTIPLPIIAFTTSASSGLESISSADLQVELSVASASDVNIDYTVTGIATGSGTDYILANGTLTIPAGSTAGDITIASIIDDAEVEGDETVIVSLSSPVNAILGTNVVHTYTIKDNDIANSISEYWRSATIIYPNPCKNTIHFDDENDEVSHITLTDISGQILMLKYYIDKKELDVSHLKAGVYLLILENNNGEKKVSKFVKQ